MSDHSPIEWTDATWNIITGCTLVSDGCRHCYAARLAATRLKNHPSRARLARLNAAGEAKFTGEVRFNEQWLDQPLRWRKPRRIFVCAHGDLFHEAVPDAWIDRVFAVMALAPHHTFQVLTKRSARMRDYFTGSGAYLRVLGDGVVDELARAGIPWNGNGLDRHSQAIAGATRWPLPNVWLGVSTEDQRRADERVPDLLATPAAVRFVSAEPLLGPIDFTSIAEDGWSAINALRPYTVAQAREDWGDAFDEECGLTRDQPALDWIIAGGESGPNARPMHPDWVRKIRDDCRLAGVAFHFKQWGAWAPFEADDVAAEQLESDELEGRIDGWFDQAMRCVGKTAAGRTLDGVEHNGFPHIETRATP